jgi:hypothetical protein
MEVAIDRCISLTFMDASDHRQISPTFMGTNDHRPIDLPSLCGCKWPQTGMNTIAIAWYYQWDHCLARIYGKILSVLHNTNSKKKQKHPTFFNIYYYCFFFYNFMYKFMHFDLIWFFGVGMLFVAICTTSTKYIYMLSKCSSDAYNLHI